ncbi:hypothetical protein A2Z67_01480 [Candidatus Woesebacteria bacterium RBG_13_36_22]|uniref:Uncharacterized protein n=1 Tax=Candidatus Woesebacteria bacterium RBG_13_36_22 TaxID=1802478 RepID=A0A1F7WZN1_9BACT|nr:MAG: hypothetical protein A2Z67_01480 [Candidatus Woesebacteria bacterium RBG_13_36_22]
MKNIIIIIVIVLLIAGVGVGFYLLGSKSINKGGAVTPTPQTFIEITPTFTPPSPTQIPLKTVMAGGILSFPKYRLSLPSDWTDNLEKMGPDAEKLIVKKGSYSISITQGGFGGAACLFPGDPDIEGPSGRYDTFTDLQDKSGDILRRVGKSQGGGFSICEKTQYGWGAPTSYGHMSIAAPVSPDPQMLTEIDAIISSLTKL